MQVCSKCQAKLDRSSLEQGVCSRCGAEIDADMGTMEPPAPMGDSSSSVSGPAAEGLGTAVPPSAFVSGGEALVSSGGDTLPPPAPAPQSDDDDNWEAAVPRPRLPAADVAPPAKAPLAKAETVEEEAIAAEAVEPVREPRPEDTVHFAPDLHEMSADSQPSERSFDPTYAVSIDDPEEVDDIHFLKTVIPERMSPEEYEQWKDAFQSVSPQVLGTGSDDPNATSQAFIKTEALTVPPESKDEPSSPVTPPPSSGAAGPAGDSSQAWKDGSRPGPETRLVIQSHSVRPLNFVPGPLVNSFDYEFQDLLGSGGMGEVYRARQTSMDREVAFKVIKRDKLQKKHHRESFLAEAVITGYIDHPNIVPVYDLGEYDSDLLFYTMKRIKGQSWLDVIHEQKVSGTLMENLPKNLDTLLKMSDAVAYAHSRGVVNRDLKPENVMLGEYGEVLVCDWGTALPTPDFERRINVRPTATVGACTPAYAAPELVTGPLSAIGYHSDIYLLGATLFHILTGKPPHPGKKTIDVWNAVRNNTIRKVEEPSEVLDIALKAMSTRPEDRYASVQEFQTAIREYLSEDLKHQESLALSRSADEAMRKASESGDYEEYSRAVFGYTEAQKLWSGNNDATTGLSVARLAYAERALEKEDFELGLQVLDRDRENPNCRPVATRLAQAQRQSQSKESRIRAFRRVALALLLIIAVGGVGLTTWALNERTQAVNAKVEADEQRDEAGKQRDIAKNEKLIADEQRKVADGQRLIAEAETEFSEQQRKLAEAKTIEADEQRDIARNEKVTADEQRAFAEEQRKIAEAKTREADEQRKAADGQRLIAEAETQYSEQQRQFAEAKTKEADEQRELAEKQRVVAEENGTEANRQAEIALKNELEAKKQKDFADTNAREAKKQELLAAYEAYIAQVSLAAEKLRDSNEFGTVLNFLGRVKAENSPHQGWEIDRLKFLTELGSPWKVSDELKSKQISAISVNQTGSYLAVGGQSGRLEVYSLLTPDIGSGMTNRQGKLVRSPPVGSPVNAVAFTPGDEYLLTGHKDGSVSVCSVAGPQDAPRVKVLKLGSAEITSLRIRKTAANTFLVATAQASRTTDDNVAAFVWDISKDPENWKQLDALKFLSGINVWSADFSLDGKHLVTAADDRLVYWSRQAKAGGVEHFVPSRELQELSGGHTGPVFAVTFSPDGQFVVTAGKDQSIRRSSPQDWPLMFQNVDVDIDDLKTPAGDAAGKGANPGGRKNLVKMVQSQEHAGEIHALQFAEDGTLVSASDDKTIRIWRFSEVKGNESLEEIKKLRGHTQSVRTFSILPRKNPSSPLTGLVIISGSESGEVKEWDVESYQEIQLSSGTLPLEKRGLGSNSPLASRRVGHSGAVQAISLDRSGVTPRLLTAGRDQSAILWDMRRALQGAAFPQDELELRKQGGAILREGHKYYVDSAIMFQRGNRSLLVTAGPDGTARLWDVKSGSQIALLNGTGIGVAPVVSKDGQWIATGASLDSNSVKYQVVAKLWKTDDLLKANGGVAERSLPLSYEYAWENIENQVESVTALAFSPDGELLAIGDTREQLSLWNLQSLKEAVVIHPANSDVQTRNAIDAVQFTADGKLCFVAIGATVETWHKQGPGDWRPDKSRTLIHQDYKDQSQIVHRLAVVSSRDGAKVRVLTITGPKYTQSSDRQPGDSPVDSRPNAFWEWDLSAAKPTGRKLELTGETYFHSLAVSPDGHELLACVGDKVNQLRTWKLVDHTGYKLDSEAVPAPLGVEGATYVPADPKISPEKISPEEGRLLVWDRAYARLRTRLQDKERKTIDSKTVRTYSPHGAIVAADFSANGRHVLTAGTRGILKIWEVGKSSRPVCSFLLRPGRTLTRAAFSEDEKTIFAACDDGQVIAWSWNPDDPETPPRIRTDDTKDSNTRRRAGKQVLVIKPDFVEVSNIGSTKPHTKCSYLDLKLSGKSLTCCDLTPDGNYFAVGTGGKDGWIAVWDIKARKQVCETFLAHDKEVTSLAFHVRKPDERNASSVVRLLSGSKDGLAKLWDPRIQLDAGAGIKTGTGGALLQARQILTLDRSKIGAGQRTADPLRKVETQPVIEVKLDDVAAFISYGDNQVILWFARPQLPLPANLNPPPRNASTDASRMRRLAGK